MIRFLVLILLIGLIPGCGPTPPKLVPAKGVVRFANGNPVRGGVIELSPTFPGGQNARGKIDENGLFTLQTDGKPGAMVGTYKAVVFQVVVADGAAAHVGAHHAKLVVHPKYAKYESSGLSGEVKDQDMNELTFVVEPAAGGRGW